MLRFKRLSEARQHLSHFSKLRSKGIQLRLFNIDRDCRLMFSICAGLEPSHVCCRIQLVVLYHFCARPGLHRLNFALYFYHQPGVLFRGLRLGPFNFSTMRLPPIVAPSASLPAALHSPCECRRRCTGSPFPSFWP